MKKNTRKPVSLWNVGLGLFAAGLLVGIACSTPWDTLRTTADLRRQLAFANGITVTMVGRVVLVTGEAESLSDYQHVQEVVGALENDENRVQIRSIVRLSEQAKTVVAELIERQIGSPEITVRARGETLMLEGTAESDFEADRAVEFTLTSVRSHVWKEAPKTDKSEKDGARVTSSEVTPRQNPWPSKIVDLMRVRPPSPKKASFNFESLRVAPIPVPQ